MNTLSWEGRRTAERCFPLGHLVSFPCFLPEGRAIRCDLGCFCWSRACRCLLGQLPICSLACCKLVSPAPPWRCPVDPWPESNLDQAPRYFVLQGLQAPRCLKLEPHCGPLCFMVVAELLWPGAQLCMTNYPEDQLGYFDSRSGFISVATEPGD